MTKLPPLRAPASLLGRTNLTLGVSSMLIAVISTIALYAFVIDPIAERSADDEAALLVLSAQTWVELPPAARPYFELELAQNHDLIISSALQQLPAYEGAQTPIVLLQQKLQNRLGIDVVLLEGDDLIWVEVPMAEYQLQIGVAPDRRDTQPLYVAIIIVGLGAAIVFFTSLFVVQRVTRPLVKVATQAERFRGVENIEPLAETGPRELVSLARNFNTMASEISVLLENRTTLMAAFPMICVPRSRVCDLPLLCCLIPLIKHWFDASSITWNLWMSSFVTRCVSQKVPAKKIRSSNWLHLSKIFSAPLNKMSC
jgi:two-component system osmolarity sensor histidine kinase EnvZ